MARVRPPSWVVPEGAGLSVRPCSPDIGPVAITKGPEAIRTSPRWRNFRYALGGRRKAQEGTGFI